MSDLAPRLRRVAVRRADAVRLWVERRMRFAVDRAFLRLFVDRHVTLDAFLRGGEPVDRDVRPLWLGVPTWKLPLDMWVYQEVLEDTRPELLIETGTQYGGSALFFATILEAIGQGEVISVDTDTSTVHSRVEANSRVTVLEGDSTSPAIVERLTDIAADRRTMVVLDSAHSYDHVRGELDALAGLVAPGCYLVLEDTALGRAYLPYGGEAFRALEEWLPAHPEFAVDRSREKFAISLNPGGWLRRRPDVR